MKYQCGGTGPSKGGISKTSILAPPEDVELNCKSATSWIVKVSTKCKVTCKTGNPNYDTVQCKAAGWRPTNEIKCEGVNPGVIVAVLIGGLAAVVIIAILYAKYRQRNKPKKKGTSLNNGTRNPGARRPGQTTEHMTNHSRPISSSSGYVGSTADSDYHSRAVSRGSWKSENTNGKSQLPDFDRIDKPTDAGCLSSNSSGGVRTNQQVNQNDRRRRPPPPATEIQQHPQYEQGYHYNDPSALQVGYNNGAYHNPAPYGYPANEPTVGYGSFGHPQAYPESRHYQRPYNVPT